MIQTIKVSSPEGMAGFLAVLDPFQGAVDGYPRFHNAPNTREHDSCHFTLSEAGYVVCHPMPQDPIDPEVQEGIDYIVRCEKNHATVEHVLFGGPAW